MSKQLHLSPPPPEVTSAPVPSPAGINNCISRSPPLPLAGEGWGEGIGRGAALNNAKTLRTNQTNAEQRLWYDLRAHRFMGLKFKRQKPTGCYIVDFVCMEHRLIIEIDGGQHAEQVEYDKRRDVWLRSQGYTVLRFWNNDVMQNLEGILEQVRCALTLSPSPSPASGRGEQHTEPQDGTPHKSPLPLAGEG